MALWACFGCQQDMPLGHLASARLLEFAQALCCQPLGWSGQGWARAGGPVGWGTYLSTRP